MGDYSLVTRHRWLWPLIELGAVLLYTIAQTAQAHQARTAARCRAHHCHHAHW
jgi:hypothetical protein